MMYKKMQLNIPESTTRVLLHVCCAPCSPAIVECMMQQGIEPILFYYNPNTYPHEEYEIRKTEIIRMTQSLGLKFIESYYDHDKWLQHTKAFKDEPEGGKRCPICFRIRLTETARYAHENGFRLFTTTLASSRWKNLEQINEAGRYAAGLFPNLMFGEQNWRKYGLSERNNKLNKYHNFYRQQYCGCEFSLRDANKWRVTHGKPVIKTGLFSH